MKKKIIVSTIILFILSFLFHSAFKYIKIPIFPVNESIWEHGKMIMLSYLVLTLIDKLIYKESNIFSNFISFIICMILDFVIFTPIFLYILKTHENMFITLLIYFICIIISLIIKEKYLKRFESKKNNYYSLFGYILITIVFLVLTYYPIELPIFYDYNKHIYGIKR